MSATATSEAPAPRTWLQRHWKWFVPFVILDILVTVGVVGGLVVVTNMRAAKSTEPYKMALELAQNDPLVKAKLGEPIHDASWFPAGSVYEKDGKGEATLLFDIQGPKGKGHVEAKGRLIQKQWSLFEAQVKFDDKSSVKLNTAEAGGIDDAPPFSG